MAWPTAQSVVTQAALELGLIQLPGDLGDNVYASSDSNIAQLLALLKKAGRNLVDEFEWQQLRAEWSIKTLAGTFNTDAAQRTGVYALPPDWRTMIDQTGWNRTQRLPMGGPLSEQEWQYLASRLTGVVWTILFKPAQGLLWLYPSTSTPAGQDITFSYKSSYWVRPSLLVMGTDFAEWSSGEDWPVGSVVLGRYSSGEPFQQNVYRCVQPGMSGPDGPDPQLTLTGVPTLSGAILDKIADTEDATGAWWNWIGTVVSTSNPAKTEQILTPSFATKDQPEAGSDVLLFDEQLLVASLKLEWRKAKGFDTTDVQVDFDKEFGRATSNNSSAPILSLNGTGITQDRLLSGLNVPITGFGS